MTDDTQEAEHIIGLVQKFKFLDWRFDAAHVLRDRMVMILVTWWAPDSAQRTEYTQVNIRLAFSLGVHLPDDYIVGALRNMVINAITHEIDEVLEFDGERPWYPHKPTGERHDLLQRLLKAAPHPGPVYWEEPPLTLETD